MPARRRTINTELFRKILKNLGACGPALNFVRGKDFRTAWRSPKARVDHADWLNWLIEKMGCEFNILDEDGYEVHDHFKGNDLFDYDKNLTIPYPYDELEEGFARKRKEYRNAQAALIDCTYTALEPIIEAYLLDYADKMDATKDGWKQGKNAPSSNW